MTTSTTLLVENESPAKTVLEAIALIPSADGELVLDFSAVQRVDANDLRALEELAQAAERDQVAVAFRGVDVSVYKVLKLGRLASRFSFVD